MTGNDLILLDSILKKLAKKSTEHYDPSEQFELFCFSQLLKDYDLSTEELEFGWVDGSDDGGIDGFYTFIDGRLITTPINSQDYRKNPNIEVVIITCKHKDAFHQIPINNILSSTRELFDLSIESDNLKTPFNDDVLQARDIFRDTYIEIIENNPGLKINFFYASRGNTSKIAVNVQARANLLVSQSQEQLKHATVDFSFIGSSELLSLQRKTRTFSLRLKFIESPISRSSNSYIVLSRLDDYFNFITDENNKLRRYLFDSNVRDYLPGSLINQDIKTTLAAKDTKDSTDFWLLNNGITILTSKASNAGKEMSLENIQIVNGLQTTETIYHHFSELDNKDDDRAVLIKIIEANDEVLRDRIIKATNNQNKVDLSNLKATDKLQKDIEQVLLENDWYYDRRKNYYRNQEKPLERIIPVAYLSQAILGLCLKKLEMAAKSRPNYMNNETTYGKLFNDTWNIKVYAAVIDIRKRVEFALSGFNSGEDDHPKVYLRRYGMLFAYIYVAQELNTMDYQPNDLTVLMGKEVDNTRLNDIWAFIKEVRDSYMKKYDKAYVKRPQRNNQFLQELELTLKSSFEQK